jgi:hypothetical protein
VNMNQQLQSLNKIFILLLGWEKINVFKSFIFSEMNCYASNPIFKASAMKRFRIKLLKCSDFNNEQLTLKNFFFINLQTNF